MTAHRAVVTPAPAGQPKVCQRCGHPIHILPGAPRWTHMETAKS